MKCIILGMCCRGSTWNNWSAWGACSENCGGGVQTRERTCQNDKFDGQGERIPCSGEDIEAFRLQRKNCNEKMCNPKNVQQVQGKWYHKCYLWGDPHVYTFDNSVVDLMQYNEIYTLVHHPEYTVKVKTTAGHRPRDPRAAMDYFILEIGNTVFTTKNRIVKYRTNGGDEETLPG